MEDRRFRIHFGPVLEKRRSRERRSGSDRRRVSDPVFRIIGDERRKAFRDAFSFLDHFN